MGRDRDASNAFVILSALPPEAMAAIIGLRLAERGPVSIRTDAGRRRVGCT